MNRNPTGHSGATPLAPRAGRRDVTIEGTTAIGSERHDGSVLLRVASLLDAFREGEVVLSLSQLVERSGLPKSTAHRLAEQLTSIGWLERDVFGYRIGIRLFEIGGLAERYRTMRERALPHLQRLCSKTGLAVQLGVLDGADVVYLERVLVRGFTLPTRSGGRQPAYCTALGKAILAFSSEEHVQLAVAAGLVPRTAHTITTAAQFARELERIRTDTFAVDREESYAGISCVAVPLRGSGTAIAAISVSGPPSRVSADQLAPVVRGTAIAVWQDVFHRGSYSHQTRTGDL